MHLRFSDTAEADLDAIHAKIVEHDARAARRIVDAILSAAYHLENFPLLGRISRVPQTRELSVPRTPYFIVYTIPDQYHVDVETIIHERQEYPPVGE